MTNLMSKVGLYDLLSMVIPGYLILFMIEKIFHAPQYWDCEEVTYWIIAFCVSYILGIIIHYISRKTFGFLHHNQDISNKAFSECERDCADRLKRSKEGNSNTSEEHYYSMYYRLWGSRSISFITPLETQLTFVRSMFVVSLSYLVFGWLFITPRWLISLIVIFAVICFMTAIKTRKRIYYYYYEAEHYLENHEKE